MLLEYKNLIDFHLNKIINESSELLIYQPIKYIVELGGKRFRSSLMLLSADIFCNNPKKAINEATALELFHNFTLIHDDIMDEAPMRRGKSSVHHKWDTNTAILSGDLLYALVNKILATSPEQTPEIHLLFQQTAMEVCEGQSLDMEFEKSQLVSQDEYLNMIKLKTAVLVGCALKIGAIIGGASKIDAELLYSFGVSLGIAFQIHDDILDVYPDKGVFGKQIGGDIIEKKKTILLINLLSKSSDLQKNEIFSTLDDTVLKNDKKVEIIKKLYDNNHVLSNAEQVKSVYYNKALENISNLNIEPESKDKLKSFAADLMNRRY
jgi:geranylgeranyl diphosphate synthase type II